MQLVMMLKIGGGGVYVDDPGSSKLRLGMVEDLVLFSFRLLSWRCNAALILIRILVRSWGNRLGFQFRSNASQTVLFFLLSTCSFD